MEAVGIYQIISSLIRIFMPIYFVNKVMPSEKRDRNKYYSFIMFILYGCIIILNSKYSLKVYWRYIIFIISLLYPMIFRPGSLGKKIFWISFYISGMSIVPALCVVVAFFTRIGRVYSVVDINVKNYGFVLAIRIFEVIFIYIVSKNVEFIRYVNGKILSILTFICIVNSIIAESIIDYAFKYANYSDYFLIFVTLGLFFIQISAFYILNTISKIMEEKFALEVTLKSKQNDEDIMRMHKEMRGWKHDMINHVNIILGLIERNSPDKAIEYIHEMDKRTSEFEEIRYTDNIAVDSILSSKVNLAKEKGIEIQMDLNVFSDIKLTNIEICTLLGNLLDNSIEACEKVEEGKFISLKILAQEDKLVVRIKNSTSGNLKQENGIFKTTKKRGMHGIGLSQIDSVVEKYDGYIKRTHENNIFDTSIMINY